MSSSRGRSPMLPAVACRTQLSGGPCPSWLQDAGFRRGACVGTSPRGKERPSSPPEKLDVPARSLTLREGALGEGPGPGAAAGARAARAASLQPAGLRRQAWKLGPQAVRMQPQWTEESESLVSGCMAPGKPGTGTAHPAIKPEGTPAAISPLRAGAERTEGRALCLGEPAGRTGVPDPRPHSLQEPSPAHLQRMPRGHP